MDVQSSDHEQLLYNDLPPVLIAADSALARERAHRTVLASRYRAPEALFIDEAPARIQLQAAASALWIELDGEFGDPLDRLLDQVSEDVGHGRYSAIVSAPASLIDPLTAKIGSADVELLIDADDCERAAALSLALARRGDSYAVNDVASDKSAVRLRQLSDEVSRIAATLARLSTGPSQASRPVEVPKGDDAPAISAETVRAVIRARRLRSRYFSEELFADPAWDMLLDLLQAEIAHLRVPVSSLCIAAAVPATTALRWLKAMTSEGLFVRRADPHDGRRVFVELAPQTSQTLRRYFADAGQVAVI
jgi:DNA-binding MarR family transcriptional regulator